MDKVPRGHFLQKEVILMKMTIVKEFLRIGLAIKVKAGFGWDQRTEMMKEK